MVKSIVDKYWNNHTVKSKFFSTKKDAEKHKLWRLKKYPFYKEFIALNESHKEQVVLDYGCGPGNDLVHFMTSGAVKIIGVDVSEKALKLAKNLISLYPENKIPIELVKTTDLVTRLPFENNSIDYIHCSGVLHHVSNPQEILKEFFRVLKDDSYARIMVYNRNSIFYHIYVAYVKGGGMVGVDTDEIFRQSTDGINCPISKAYTPEEFITLCKEVGFSTEYLGGYFSSIDTISYVNKHKNKMWVTKRLKKEHRKFAMKVEIDEKGYPTYANKYCGIGGVFKLHKRGI